MNRISQKYKKETGDNPCKKSWFGFKFYTENYVKWLERIVNFSLKASSVNKTGLVDNSILLCKEPLRLAEREVIEKYLVKNNGHREQTAKDLNINQRTLYRRIKEYNL